PLAHFFRWKDWTPRRHIWPRIGGGIAEALARSSWARLLRFAAPYKYEGRPEAAWNARQQIGLRIVACSRSVLSKITKPPMIFNTPQANRRFSTTHKQITEHCAAARPLRIYRKPLPSDARPIEPTPRSSPADTC